MKNIIKLTIVMLVLGVQYSVAETILYVKSASSGTKSGTSWANALPADSLQYAINTVAVAGGGQVWVAAGTYYPTQDTAKNSKPADVRTKTFTLRSNVAVYGGFAGTETSINQRQRSDLNGDKKISAWEFTNETVLSGDIQKDNKDSLNVFHVVSQLSQTVSNCVLDGCSIIGGYAALWYLDVNKFPTCNVSSATSCGGGAYLFNTKLSRCIIAKNFAYYSGAGVYLLQSTMDSSYMHDNACMTFGSSYGGGVMINETGTISNCLFEKNKGVDGAAVFLNAGGRVVSCIITKNIGRSCVGTTRGGIFDNCLIYKNKGYVDVFGGSIVSSTIAENGVALLSRTSVLNAIILDSIMNDKVYFPASCRYSFFRRNILTTDTLKNLIDTKYSYTKYFTDTNYTLCGTSPLINKGMPDVGSLNLAVVDLYNNPRISYGRIDIGAHELLLKRYVTPNGSGDLSGFNWDNAMPGSQLRTAFDLGAVELWLSGGVYNIGTAPLTLHPKTRVYGGFSLTRKESSPADRQKSDVDNNGVIEQWEFTNASIITQPTSITDRTDYMINGRYADEFTLLDGLTVSDSKAGLNGLPGLDPSDGGALIINNGTVQNCIFRNNEGNVVDNKSPVTVSGIATVKYCLFENNRAYGYGGGALWIDKNGSVLFSVIRGNKSLRAGGNGNGGGVELVDNATLGESLVYNNYNDGNSSTGDATGGGIDMWGGIIRNCVIANNTSFGMATRGGGVFINEKSNAKIINSTIINNQVIGSNARGNDLGLAEKATIKNTVFGSPTFMRAISPENKISFCASPVALNDYGIDSIRIYNGMTDLYNQFIKPTQFIGNAKTKADSLALAAANWHLKSTSWFINDGYFAATDTLLPTIDADSSARVNYKTIDLGAYEATITKAKLPVLDTVQMIANKSNYSITYKWTNVAADRYLLFIKEGNSERVQPIDNTPYTGDLTYGKGSNCDGWYCVYNGTGFSATVLGLAKGTNYKAILVTQSGLRYFLYNSGIEKNTIEFITKRDQTISLNVPKMAVAGSSFLVDVSATSGFDVALSTTDSKYVSINGTRLTILKADNSPRTISITASQNGGTLYEPATAVTKTIEISKATQTISFAPIAEKVYGNEMFTPVVKASSGLEVKLALSNDTAVQKMGSSFQIIGVGTVKITASQAGDSVYEAAPSITQEITVKKAPQVISFPAIAEKTYGNEDFTPAIKASSGLQITLKSNNESLVSVINGNSLHIKDTGTVTITASQKGNAFYDSAQLVSQTFHVERANQYITFNTIADKVYGSGDFSLNASSSANLPLSFASNNENAAQVIDGKVRIVGIGTVTITATQAGDSLYKAAQEVKQSFTVKRASQFITFNPIADKVYGSGDFSLNASSSANLPLSFASSNENVAQEIDGKVHIVGVGSVTITATQGGDTYCEAAQSISQSFEIKKAEQFINTGTYYSKTIGDADFTLEKLSSAQLPITYSSTSKLLSIDGNTVHIIGCGSALIMARQEGNSFINKANDIAISVIINKKQQEITFDSLKTIRFSDTLIKPHAYSSQGLPVKLSSSDNSVAHIENDSLVRIVGAGSVIIYAAQNGNDNVAAAETQQQTLIVEKAKQQLIFTNPVKTLVYGQDTTLDVTSNRDLLLNIASKNQSIISVDNNTLRTRGVGKVAIRISQAGTAGISAVERIDTIEVVRANQTILDLEDMIHTLNGAPALQFNASSSTGFAVKYQSLNQTVASCTGNRVTINAPGVCKLVASVPQSANYNAASDTCTIVVSALNVLTMPSYTITRDTVIDLNTLRLNHDSFNYSFTSAQHNTVTIHNSKATIIPSRSAACWTGTDTLWFKASNQTIKADTLVFGLKITRNRFADQIGLVTTDSLTGSYNIVAWKAKDSAATRSWTVYRRSQSLSQWDSLGQVANTDTTVFVDKKVTTKQQAYQYVLVTNDEYGCKSPMSKPHTTMHLKTGVSLQNYPQLWWSAYEGVEVESYIIYRENVQTKQLEAIGSTFLTSFTDEKPNGTNNYRVAIQFAQPLKPTSLKTDTGPFSQSLSNMSEASLVDLAASNNAVNVSVYPNPAKDELSISADERIESIAFIATDGSIVKQINSLGTAEPTVSVKDLAKGFYSMVVTTASDVKTIKLTVQ